MRVSSLKASLLVARTELRGSFRDRQTILYSIVLPVCMYPVLFWIMVQGALLVQGRQERTEVRVGLAMSRPGPARTALIDALEGRRPGEAPDADAGPVVDAVRVVDLGQGIDAQAARARLAAARAGEDEELDAVLWLPVGGDELAPDASARLYFHSSESRSRLARTRVETRLESLRTRLRGEAAADAGQTPEALVPFDVEETNVAPQRDMLAYLLSFLLPMLLVVMCVMGAFFPAVDVVAGEKERSTAETTLLLPVPRAAVHQGKILAVSAASVLASTLNLAALGLSAGHLLSMLRTGFGSNLSELPILALFGVLPLALLFAFFVSSILVGVASLASTFREGQALLGPVQMVFILPAIAGVMPGLELSLGTACVPVLNVVLAFRAMLQGQVLPGEYALTGLSLLFYALIAIRVALRVLSREDVQLSRETISLSRIASVLRSTGHAR